MYICKSVQLQGAMFIKRVSNGVHFQCPYALTCTNIFLLYRTNFAVSSSLSEHCQSKHGAECGSHSLSLSLSLPAAPPPNSQLPTTSHSRRLRSSVRPFSLERVSQFNQVSSAHSRNGNGRRNGREESRYSVQVKG